jgi:cytochrome c biogenesis protein CcmG/thiol:disulfide interchange protein DsbE
MSDSTVPGAGASGHRAGRTGIFRFTAVVLVVVVLLFLLLVRLLAASQAANHAASATTGGQVSQRAPDFTLAVWNLAPSSLSLRQLQGQPVVVNFWASWCAPCQQEAPLLTAAAHTDARAGVVFIGVAEQTMRSDGTEFLAQHGIPYPCGPDPNGGIATAFGVPGLPVTVFINRQGRVASRITGQLTQASLAAGLRAITG